MLHKIIATMLTLSLVSSLTFAQEMPGNASPVAPVSSEETLILNSASDAPSDFETLSEVTITPEVDEAVFEFSTDTAVHAVIEYGLTREYDHSLTTEPQKMHTETIGELTACATYYYHISVGEESREGAFETLCPVVVKKPAPRKIQSTKYIVQNEQEVQKTEEIVQNEEELVLNAAPDEEIQNTKDKVQNGEIRVEKTPESPILPGPIAFGNDTLTKEKIDTKSTLPVGLLLFALVSGMVVMLVSFKKNKKWYQK